MLCSYKTSRDKAISNLFPSGVEKEIVDRREDAVDVRHVVSTLFLYIIIMVEIMEPKVTCKVTVISKLII